MAGPPETLSLDGLATPEAAARNDAMLRALQRALRKAMAAGPAAAEDREFWAAMEEFYGEYDRWIAGVGAVNAFTCGRGCSACCHDNPHGVAGVELLRLWWRLRSEGRLASIRPAVQSASSAFRASVLEHGERGAMEGQRALHRPCPLLGVEGECTVYADRPVACRMFHAVTPATWCDPTHAEFQSRVNPHLLPPLVCRQILGAISRCLGLPASTTLWEGLDGLMGDGGR